MTHIHYYWGIKILVIFNKIANCQSLLLAGIHLIWYLPVRGQIKEAVHQGDIITATKFIQANAFCDK